MIPTVTTENLILRGQESRDFDGYAAFWASNAAGPFGGPFTRSEAWDSFLADAGHWIIRGFGQWMVAARETGEAIGWVGFVHADDGEEPELGWTVYPDHEGKSLAYEASVAARAFGAQEFGISRPASFIRNWNVRSMALAERLSAVRETTREDDKGTIHLYRHPEVLQ